MQAANDSVYYISLTELYMPEAGAATHGVSLYVTILLGILVYFIGLQPVARQV